MSTLFIADLHLEDARPDSTDQFLRFLDVDISAFDEVAVIRHCVECVCVVRLRGRFDLLHCQQVGGRYFLGRYRRRQIGLCRAGDLHVRPSTRSCWR